MPKGSGVAPADTGSMVVVNAPQDCTDCSHAILPGQVAATNTADGTFTHASPSCPAESGAKGGK